MERVGKFDLVRQIGRGATSTVYLARDPFTLREVAIKVGSPEILKDDKRRRLYSHLYLNEAALIGKLLHPHIVQIYDAVVDDQCCYIVMEYVAGGTLEQACTPDTLLPIQRVVEIVFKCTRALDFAFRAGIIHRDIKPANILFAGRDPYQGEIKISDFGAAIIASPDHTLVLGVGSPAYMSPQQVKEQTLDHQTDIYSLGVVMYQLLTGQLPFQGRNSYEMIYQIINHQPPPPSSLRSAVPDVLDAIVARAMSKRLKYRYRNWQDFAHDLARSLRDQRLKYPVDHVTDLEKFETLRAFSFFGDFSDVEIWEVVRLSEWQCFAPEAVVIREGEQGGSFYLVAEGELKVMKSGMVLNVLAAGDCFGEMATISKEKWQRGADVVALTGVKLVRVTSTALSTSSTACKSHFYQAFLTVLCERLAAANERMVSF